MRADTERDYQARMLRVLVHIQNHLDDAISLDDLAAVAHFSAHHFHRIFRGMVGESVMGHVRRLRLERAAHRLKFGSQPVTRVAFEAGYETHEAFTRAFAAAFGVPPSQYREQHRTHPGDVPFAPDARPLQAGGPPPDVRIERLRATRVAFLRHVGPYSEVGAAWGRLYAWAGPRGLIGRGAKTFGIVHDDPEVTPPDKVRYDACVAVDDRFQGEGGVGVQVIGGEYAATTHRGPYDALGGTYARLCGAWLPASGRELAAAPGFEVYRNAPAGCRADDLLTDVHLPLAPRGDGP